MSKKPDPGKVIFDRYQRGLAKLDIQLDAQSKDGQWNMDEYGLGILNGLLLAKACMEGKKPEFMPSPEKFLKASSPREAELQQQIEKLESMIYG